MKNRKEVIKYYLNAWNRKEYGNPSLQSIKSHVRAYEKINQKDFKYKKGVQHDLYMNNNTEIKYPAKSLTAKELILLLYTLENQGIIINDEMTIEQLREFIYKINN